MIPVKICGITRLQDALQCVEYGVSAVGFVFAPSQRRMDPAAAAAIARKLPPFLTKVGVFVDEDPLVIREIMADCALDLAQLHGGEAPECAAVLAGRVIKAFRAGAGKPDSAWREAPLRGVLVDAFSPRAHGGTGQTFEWSLIEPYRALGHPLILAGGLHPGNIRAALAAVRPAAVDLSSGVEREPGIKDPHKIRELMAAVRDCAGGDNYREGCEKIG